MSAARRLAVFVFLLAACGDDSAPADVGRLDAGRDASDASDAGVDAPIDSGADAVDAATEDGGVDAGADAFVSCIEAGLEAGERFPVGDRCNFCDCNADGTTTCTDRVCLDSSIAGCEYDGVMHGYGERFPSTDACNQCVCAASGLACTRRLTACPDSPEEGAILLESLDEPCGPDAAFTPLAVLEGLPHRELTVPLNYNRVGGFYAETRADTELTLRVLRDQGGYAVCRIPSEGQEAIDMEVLVEWFSADGAFDETFRSYLRRNAGGFTNVWTTVSSLAPGTLNGDYTPGCPDFRGYAFDATFDFDGSASGSARKTCEADISLTIASFEFTP